MQLFHAYLDISLPTAAHIVNGNSMSANNIREGDMVIVLLNKEVRSGDIAVIEVKGERYVKRIFFHKNMVICRSESLEKKYKDWKVKRSDIDFIKPVLITVQACNVRLLKLLYPSVKMVHIMFFESCFDMKYFIG